MVHDMNRLAKIILSVGLLCAATLVAPLAHAEPLQDVISQIRDSGGRYVRAGASLRGADCSGLVSVALSLATGRPIQRLGDTRSLLAGRWPDVIRGANPADLFVIGVNSAHMTMSILGTNIESSTSGQPYRIGAPAASPFEPRFQQFHVRPESLIAI